MKLYPEFFHRLDENPDVYFYLQPRQASHLDEASSRAAEKLYDEILVGGNVLDLMASSVSHLPRRFRSVTGLGLNTREMERNSLLRDYVLHDLNSRPVLPFKPETFDGVVCTASVQYLTRPLEVFAEVARCLKPGAPFVVTFSNRMFPTKAVLAWRSTDDAAHVRLVEHYFRETPGFGPFYTEDRSPRGGDPLYATWAYKRL